MSNREAFIKSYNHFDGCPLIGQTLRGDFYIDDFCKTSVKEIVTTVEISAAISKCADGYCCAVTILSKLAEELSDNIMWCLFRSV